MIQAHPPAWVAGWPARRARVSSLALSLRFAHFASLVRLVSASLLVLALAGCGQAGREDMQDWMAQHRAGLSPRIAPIAEPPHFVPQAYVQAGTIDPFSPQKLASALRRDATVAASESALLAPELKRRKEALESYPLDAMAMVGSLIKQGRPVALIKADNQLYQASVGQYLGQNYGRILRIGETEVQLREIVRDPGGNWVERPVTLQLQERAK